MNSSQKKILIPVVFLAALFIVYKLAIKNTLELKSEYSELLKEKQLLDNATAEINYLNKKKRHLDAFLKENKISVNSSFQQILLQKITQFSLEDKVEIKAFNKPHIQKNNSTVLETYSFEIKGSYMKILKLINYIEKSNLGELFSVSFEKKKNYRTRKEFLTAKIYLRRLKNK
ncbi:MULTISPECIES: hypothetical protein [unclassified Tenacibaculum]|uniref:hypothetical protein n=1 Tax=unclassified Tenacibaculum TaxID=2635139 RepID=UPI001F20C3B5|nr:MULTISPECIES: hypothetical protein [unclassified Tenacibaculum]MCF2875145.1 hypothetical protein [Tenacibaculum sp. Cn5-1]MCF2935221.1 hypothetical protein [Tenacibaculum sp. Cn5-34]MCG7511337.1 hypothetical protein [Tenacibaculum sp. Cn5-46]